MANSLFDKYGGFSKISKVVMDFYDRLLDDDDLGPFFEDVDMARIVDHQTKFMATLLGGPASYTDDQIRHLHRHLKIGDPHFDRLKVILAETLADHGMEPADVVFVAGQYESRRAQVVTG